MEYAANLSPLHEQFQCFLRLMITLTIQKPFKIKAFGGEIPCNSLFH
jgi:hypothetical protein